MGKGHLKRLAAPKSWQVSRKEIKFITKPSAGPHNLSSSIPISTLLKEILNYASTTKEVKKIMNNNEIKVDGKVRRDFRFPIGIFDTIGFKSINENFRVVLNTKGKLDMIKIGEDESLLKPCKIVGKKMVRGKLQLNLYDGRNLNEGSNSYQSGDTVLLSLPEQKIIKHFKLKKKSAIFLTGGKHIGEVGNVEDVIENRIIYRTNKGNLIETSKKYAFVVGDDKPSITLNENKPDEKD
ncbi:30S ribosomal protein S4e [Candidatus Woesearchaeota archaeon]|nr:30S ribosomal protein S4e [Candidatus Woesearchaeota archaeon]